MSLDHGGAVDELGDALSHIALKGLGHDLVPQAAGSQDVGLVDGPDDLVAAAAGEEGGVVVTSNLFGNIISDEASIIPDSLGLLSSASLSGIPDGQGIYETIHGKAFLVLPLPSGLSFLTGSISSSSTSLCYSHLANTSTLGSAPDISSKGLVNPVGTSEVGDAITKELTHILSN